MEGLNSRVLSVRIHRVHLRDCQDTRRGHWKGNGLPGVFLMVAKVRKMYCILDESWLLSQAHLL